MLKDGRDKEHSVDLDTIIAGFLQSVRVISFPHFFWRFGFRYSSCFFRVSKDSRHSNCGQKSCPGSTSRIRFYRQGGTWEADTYLERLGPWYSQVIAIFCVCNTPFELPAIIQATRPRDLQYFSNQLATEALAAPARSNSGSKSCA